LFRHCSVSTINNNVDTDLFAPLDRAAARRELGIEEGRNLVLIGAQDVASIYKGFDLFLAALSELRGEDLHILTFGKSGEFIPASLGFPVTNLGFLSNSQSLRIAYSAADVFVASSRAEAFGKTLAEAMSCGTPVVGFDATGPGDIIVHKESGYKATPFDPADLAQGIRWVLTLTSDAYQELCRNACQRAQREFDSRVIAEQYAALYKELLHRSDEFTAAGAELA
jgi:glycosyltransferase involved in cell wall biosynthesis